MKKSMVVASLASVSLMVTLTGCAGIGERGVMETAYDMAVTRHDATSCVGIKGMSFSEVQSKLDLKPDTIDDLSDGKQKMLFTKGNFEAEVIFNSEGKVESTLCGDKDKLRKQRVVKSLQSRRPEYRANTADSSNR